MPRRNANGRQRKSRRRRFSGLLVAAFVLSLAFQAGWGSRLSLAQSQPTLANTAPLILPAGLAVDGQGNIFFAETGNHTVREISKAGVLSTLAGTGVQGFGGDGGPASAALLDSPTAVALDGSGNLLVADAHNHRLRRIDVAAGTIATIAGTGEAGSSVDGTLATAAKIDLPVALGINVAGDLYFADARTHLIRKIDHTTNRVFTVAGNGIQGFAGDLGQARAAAIDAPWGLAFDSSSNLYFADTHNHRVRRVDAVTGVITTVAGTGVAAFSGEAGAATQAALSLPRGLAFDAAGDLYLVDAGNHRVRRVDASSGKIVSVAGNGIEGASGTGGPAAAASLDSPRAIAATPGSGLAISDTGNRRIVETDPAGALSSAGGLGIPTTAVALTLSGPSVVMYGTGSLAATLVSSPATGSVTFFDAANALAALPLTGNVATFSSGSLAAGVHRVSATYPGDTQHAAAQSSALSLSVTPASATAVPGAVSLLYGQPIPLLGGQLSGVLPRDAGAVGLLLTTHAAQFSAPGVYPIDASLSGAQASNYLLSSATAAVTIAKAASITTVTSGANGLQVHVAPATAGVATGSVSILDGNTVFATSGLSAGGDALISTATLSAGSHTLSATYPGDADLLPSSSGTTLLSVGGAAQPDFSLAATGQTAVTIPPGNSASFSFAVTPVNGALSSPTLLSASGLPFGASASFNPGYLPPAATPGAFILTVQTPKTAMLREPNGKAPWLYAGLLPLIFLVRRARRAGLAVIVVVGLGGVAGCGDRVRTLENAAAARTYNITVTATATGAGGATLVHTATVTLTVQ